MKEKEKLKKKERATGLIRAIPPSPITTAVTVAFADSRHPSSYSLDLVFHPIHLRSASLSSFVRLRSTSPKPSSLRSAPPPLAPPSFLRVDAQDCHRGAIVMLEAEVREFVCNLNTPLEEKSSSKQNMAAVSDPMKKQEFVIVRIDHMARALSKTHRSPVVDFVHNLCHIINR
ncbi:hypothetical protein HN51_028582 [Arachis hypogaea]